MTSAHRNELSMRKIIAVFGATGFAGGTIANALRERGHEVRGIASTANDNDKVISGSVFDETFVRSAVADVDAVVIAIPPLVDRKNALIEAVDILRRVQPGLRVGIVGGAGSLRNAEGVRVLDSGILPSPVLPGASAHVDALNHLRDNVQDLDWFYLSPAAQFGKRFEIQFTGAYVLGKDDLLYDEEGNSTVSGVEFSAAFVDEVERPVHHRERFTVLSVRK